MRGTFPTSISTAEFDMDRVILYQLYKMQRVASLSFFWSEQERAAFSHLLPGTK
jgi:hypothetical protein